MSLPDDALAARPGVEDAFDRDWRLDELLPTGQWVAVERDLCALAAAPVRVVAGRLSGAEEDADAHASPLTVDLEPIGWLIGPAAAASVLDAAAGILRHALVARQRYLMASALHVESVRADYAALLEKHAALEASEQRYRSLAGQLEARVAEQVAVIEARQRQLYQGERLASIGQLAAGVAHEINNPIGFVRSNLGTARNYLADLARVFRSARAGDSAVWTQVDVEFVLEDFGELLADSIAGIDRVAAIVRDLKGFSCVDRDDVAAVDLGQSLDQLCALLAPRLLGGAEFVRTGEASRALVCRPGLLHQALFNVVDNAIKAIAGAGTITIDCRVKGDVQRIVVVDDGCGIAPESLDRVFDPFFTTRPVGSGVGLGLTLARDAIVAQHGQIRVFSRPGDGTRVEIDLPLEVRS